MAPTCTPDKKNDYENKPANSTELYFEFNSLSTTNSTTGLNESNKMNKLLEEFPEVNNLFDFVKKVGHGTFSTVYLATLKRNNEKQYAVKHIVPTCHPDRIKFELQCLQIIGGVDNIVGIDLSFRNLNSVIFIMPYQPHDFFGDYVSEMDGPEMIEYMRNLLLAIARVHQFNVVHRDIKPSNFLYDRKNRKYLLVDFGLAHTVSAPLKPADTGTKRKRDDSSPSLLDSTVKKSTLCTTNGSSQKENDANLKLKGVARQLSFTNYLAKPVQSMSKMPSSSSIAFTKSPPLKSTVETETEQCGCYGKPRTCGKCLAKKNLKALRAGTPGFRPPEVLLKALHQDTAVDIWAAGIIMLSILSGSCNFFASPDDMTALSEMITIFGFNVVKKIANQCGRHLICSEKCVPLDLQKICRILKARDTLMQYFETENMCSKCNQLEVLCVCIGTPLTEDIKDLFPTEAYDLLVKLLEVNPKTRISAADALQHPLFKN